MDSFKLSIVITCHNDGKYIKQCIESIISQTNGKIEVICVDDASTDNSRTLLHSYEPTITLKYFQENIGLSLARNAAIKIAHGEYIMFVDGDDFIASDTLERILLAISGKKFDVVFGLMEVFKDTSDVADRWNDPIIEDSSIFENKSDGEILTNIHKMKLKIAPVQKYILRKQFILNNNLWFEDVLHEDQLWTPKMLCSAQGIGFLNTKFYYHRIRKNSLGDRFDEEVCNSYFSTCEKLLAFAINIVDNDKAMFLRERCKYLLQKINYRINEWDIERRKNFLYKFKTTICNLHKKLNLEIIGFEVLT